MDDINTTFTNYNVLLDTTPSTSRLQCLEDLYDSCGLKIINYNIGGISKNFNLIEMLLSNKKQGQQPDVLNISETWLGKNSRIKLDIKGYKYIRKDRAGLRKKKGGGLLVYYAENLSIDTEVYENYMYSSDDFEMLPYLIKCKEENIIVCHT